MSTASPTEDSSDRKQLLADLKENCEVHEEASFNC